MTHRFVFLGIFAIAFMLLFGSVYAQHSYAYPYDRYGNPAICGYDYYGNPYYCNNGYGDGYNYYGYGPYWNGHHENEWREHHERGERHEGGEHHHDRD